MPTSRLAWSTAVDSITQFDLFVPLQNKRPARAPITTSRESRDRSAVSRVIRGSGFDDALVEIQYEEWSDALRAFLIASIEQGQDITYTRDLDTPGETEIFAVVFPETITTEMQERALRELSISLRIRKISGTKWLYLM